MRGESIGRPNRARIYVHCAAILCCVALPQSHATLTNLAIGNFDFEDTAGLLSGPGQYDQAVFEAEYPQWDTAGNGFEITTQGSNSAPTTFSGGAATGQSLEIRGNGNNGQITLIVAIPNNPNILPGAAAELRFQAWSEDNGATSYANTGTVRVRVNGVNQTTPAAATVTSNTANTASTAWTLNTIAFNVTAGDSVNIQWRDSGPSGRDFGLRIDDVQLLVNIVPEPSLIGSIMLGGIMAAGGLRRRWQVAR